MTAFCTASPRDSSYDGRLAGDADQSAEIVHRHCLLHQEGRGAGRLIETHAATGPAEASRLHLYSIGLVAASITAGGHRSRRVVIRPAAPAQA